MMKLVSWKSTLVAGHSCIVGEAAEYLMFFSQTGSSGTALHSLCTGGVDSSAGPAEQYL